MVFGDFVRPQLVHLRPHSGAVAHEIEPVVRQGAAPSPLSIRQIESPASHHALHFDVASANITLERTNVVTETGTTCHQPHSPCQIGTSQVREATALVYPFVQERLPYVPCTLTFMRLRSIRSCMPREMPR